MTVEDNELKLIGGNEGDLNGSPSPSTLSPADWSATGGRRRKTRKSRGKKPKTSGGMEKPKTMGGKGPKRTGKKGKKSRKSRKSKSRRR